jgi:hypothetical protein
VESKGVYGVQFKRGGCGINGRMKMRKSNITVDSSTSGGSCGSIRSQFDNIFKEIQNVDGRNR